MGKALKELTAGEEATYHLRLAVAAAVVAVVAEFRPHLPRQYRQDLRKDLPEYRQDRRQLRQDRRPHPRCRQGLHLYRPAALELRVRVPVLEWVELRVRLEWPQNYSDLSA